MLHHGRRGILASRSLQFIASNLTISASGTSISVSVPSDAQTGDLLVVIGLGGVTTTGIWSGPAGWTEQYDQNGRMTYSVIWDGAASSYSFTSTDAGTKTAGMLCFRNASYGANSTSASAVTDPIASSFTVPANNSINIAVATLAASGNTYAVPSGFTQLQASSTTNSILIVKRTALINAGTASTITFTRTGGTGTTSRAWQISISPT